MLQDYTAQNEKETRAGFGEGIHEVAKTNPNVVALTADLAGSLKLNAFIKDFPERFIQCGIAEANMIGIGAGHSACAGLSGAPARSPKADPGISMRSR